MSGGLDSATTSRRTATILSWRILSASPNSSRNGSLPAVKGTLASPSEMITSTGRRPGFLYLSRRTRCQALRRPAANGVAPPAGTTPALPYHEAQWRPSAPVAARPFSAWHRGRDQIPARLVAPAAPADNDRFAPRRPTATFFPRRFPGPANPQFQCQWNLTDGRDQRRFRHGHPRFA